MLGIKKHAMVPNHLNDTQNVQSNDNKSKGNPKKQNCSSNSDNLLESGAVLSPNSFLYCAKKYDSFKLSIILWCILQNRLILVYKSAFQCGQKNNPSPRLSLCSILFFSTSSLA